MEKLFAKKQEFNSLQTSVQCLITDCDTSYYVIKHLSVKVRCKNSEKHVNL